MQDCLAKRFNTFYSSFIFKYIYTQAVKLIYVFPIFKESSFFIWEVQAEIYSWVIFRHLVVILIFPRFNFPKPSRIFLQHRCFSNGKKIFNVHIPVKEDIFVLIFIISLNVHLCSFKNSAINVENKIYRFFSPILHRVTVRICFIEPS